MPALQRQTFWAKERFLGDLRQSVPQNGRVHLLGVDKRGSNRGLTFGLPRGGEDRVLVKFRNL